MSYSRDARSPLSIADDVFTLAQQDPSPLGLHPADLADPDPLGPPVGGLGGRCGGPIPLAQLRTYLCRASTPAVVKRRAWSVLVARAQDQGGAWTLGAVGVALPKLVLLASTLAGGDPNARPELDTEVLGGFLHGLARARPASAGVFLFLLREAHRAGVAWLRQQRGADALISEEGPGSAPPPAPWGHPDLVLVRAVHAGVITTDEAALIGTTRLEDISAETIAAHTRVSVWAVFKRRRRAELRLLAYLSEHAAHTDKPDPPHAHPHTRARPTPTPAAHPLGRPRGGAGSVGLATAHRSACPKPSTDRALYPCGTPVRAAPGPASRRGRRSTRPDPAKQSGERSRTQ